MSDPIFVEEFNESIYYIRSIEHKKFMDWWRQHSAIKSLSFACQIYAAETKIILKPQDFMPF